MHENDIVKTLLIYKNSDDILNEKFGNKIAFLSEENFAESLKNFLICRGFIRVAVLGETGKGKSTFLNYLINGHDEGPFECGFSNDNVTKSVSPEVNVKVGSYSFVVHDVPGLFGDIGFKEWTDVVQAGFINKKINGLFMVFSVIDRTTILNSLQIQGLEYFLTNYQVEYVLFVFTHCDNISKKQSFSKEAQEKHFKSFLQNIRNDLTRINKQNILPSEDKLHSCYFGMNKEPFKSEFRSSVNSFLQKIANNAQELEIKTKFDQKEFLENCAKLLDAKTYERYFRRCYDAESKIIMKIKSSSLFLEKKLEEIKSGDEILTFDPKTSEIICEPVLAVSAYEKFNKEDFLMIRIENSQNEMKFLKISKFHLIQYERENEQLFSQAKDLQLNDYLFYLNLEISNPFNDFTLEKAKITKLEKIKGELKLVGNVWTPSGNLIVNNLLCSSFYDKIDWKNKMIHNLAKVAFRISKDLPQRIKDVLG